MSDMMLLGVLRMPMNNPTPLQLAQFITRARQAASQIEADAKEIERLNEALAASRAENSRLRRRRNEIDDEAEEYAEQVERLHAKLQRLQSTNHHIATMLSNAERVGGETDQPEGTRYITLSDTLARQIVKELTAEDEEE